MKVVILAGLGTGLVKRPHWAKADGQIGGRPIL